MDRLDYCYWSAIETMGWDYLERLPLWQPRALVRAWKRVTSFTGPVVRVG